MDGKWMALSSGDVIELESTDRVEIPESIYSKAGIHASELITYKKGGDGWDMALERWMLYQGYIPADETKQMADDIANLTEGQIRARGRMYINSAREGYERAQGALAYEKGYVNAEWIRDISAESCPDCEMLEQMGVQPAPEGGGFLGYDGEIHFPGDGKTICKTACRCGIRYTDQNGQELWGVQ